MGREMLLVVVLIAGLALCVSGEKCLVASRRCVCTHDWRVVSCTSQGMTTLPDISSPAKRLQVEVFQLQGNVIRVLRVADILTTFPNLSHLDVRLQHLGGRCTRVIGHDARLNILTDCDFTTEIPTTYGSLPTTDAGLPPIPVVAETTEDFATTITPTTGWTTVSSPTTQQYDTPTVDTATLPDDREDDIPNAILIAVSTLSAILLLFLINCCWWLLCKAINPARPPCPGYCTCCPRNKPRQRRRRDDDDDDAANPPAIPIETLSYESIELYSVPRSRGNAK